MAISNIRQSGDGTFRATADSVSGPHQFGLNGIAPDTLAEARTRHGAMDPGQELVGVHFARPGSTFSLKTAGEQVHVIEQRTDPKLGSGTTSDAHVDPALDPMVAEVRLKEMQRRNAEFWSKPRS